MVPIAYRYAAFLAFGNLAHLGVATLVKLATEHFVWFRVKFDGHFWPALSCNEKEQKYVGIPKLHWLISTKPGHVFMTHIWIS